MRGANPARWPGSSAPRALHRIALHSWRRPQWRALLLIAPLLLFILLTFVFPIADMLYRSVENGIVADTLPTTVIALKTWDPQAGELPDEPVFAALAADLTLAVAAKNHTRLGGRLNHERPGFASLFRKTGRALGRFSAGHYKKQFIEANTGWASIANWAALKRLSPPFTDSYFLDALDHRRGLADTARENTDWQSIVRKPEQERVHITLFIRTLVTSIAITCICIVLAYPLAYLLANLPVRTSNLLLILVLLPFWTSLLVRTSAWKVLLQQQGVINDILYYLGIVADDSRLNLINNMTGTLISMVHILLPFMVLSLFAAMKTISPTLMRAARGLGASDWAGFRKVYFPNTIAGLGAGSILVFTLSIGFYITPELVGGRSGAFISNRIAYHILSSLNWGLAAALGTLLLLLVLALYWVYDRIVGLNARPG